MTLLLKQVSAGLFRFRPAVEAGASDFPAARIKLLEFLTWLAFSIPVGLAAGVAMAAAASHCTRRIGGGDYPAFPPSVFREAHEPEPPSTTRTRRSGGC